MALEAYSSWNFTDLDSFFSATNPMDICWETCSNSAFKEINPHGVFNAFPYQPMGSVGVDLRTFNDMPTFQPEAMITQFNDIYVDNNIFCHDETHIVSPEPNYQHDECLMNPASPIFMDLALDFEQVPVLCEEDNFALRLPCHVGDEAESNRIIVENLLKAWAEALEREALDLLKAIVNRLRRRVSLTGSHVERVGYYCLDASKDSEAQESAASRLMEEICMQSSVTAFQALYQLYPHSRFAHFTANQSILECFASNNSNRLHIVDFDVMEGLQWPPLMAALSEGTVKCLELLRITAVKWDDDAAAAGCHGVISAGNTGSRLAECAASLGIPFFYEEIRLQDLKHRMFSATDVNVSVVFNMMLELPHMTCQRSKAQILEFLSIARGLRPAILTLASAGVESDWRDYGGHLSDTVEYMCAMSESLEAGLPDHCLARSVMEHIFLAPKIRRSVSSGGTQWNENEKEKELIAAKVCELPGKCGFSGAGEISEESMAQATEVLSFNRGWHYTLEKLQNEIILKWRDTPLVWASAWT